MCLDECTANVDTQTASLLQNTISNDFRGATVITIAHRISTVLNMDNILVLDRGTLVCLFLCLCCLLFWLTKRLCLLSKLINSQHFSLITNRLNREIRSLFLRTSSPDFQVSLMLLRCEIQSSTVALICRRLALSVTQKPCVIVNAASLPTMSPTLAKAITMNMIIID